MDKESFVNVDEKYETSSKNPLEFDEIKVEEHDELNDEIYQENVSINMFFYNLCSAQFLGMGTQ